ncbi:MAG: iron chelate uptake ABC transporter family permease subunit, partial [Candidatus Competibacterales bacterium]
MGRGASPALRVVGGPVHLAAGLACGLGALAFGALLIGPYPLSPDQALGALVGQGDPQVQAVVLAIRLPRILAALLVGAALAAAGASYQTLFRNPLVSPDILGVSAGAGGVWVFRDGAGGPAVAPVETQLAVLRALGVPVDGVGD